LVFAESERGGLHMTAERINKKDVLATMLLDERFTSFRSARQMLSDFLDCGGFALLNEQDYIDLFGDRR
jgi:hypothetical protein